MMSVLALSKGQGLVIAALGAVFLVAAGASLYARTRRKEAAPDIPPAMRPGPSDVDLETPLLAKLQGWGLLMVVFLAVWIPLVGLNEPTQNLHQERALTTDSIDRGKAEIQLFSESNQTGVGCVRCHGPELRGQPIPLAGTTYPSANLTTVCSRLDVTAIRTTIEQGRMVTIAGQTVPAMPSWSIRYAGALDDQQISDLIAYLISINRETVPFAENKCLNPKAGATPTPAPSPSGSPGK